MTVFDLVDIVLSDHAHCELLEARRGVMSTTVACETSFAFGVFAVE